VDRRFQPYAFTLKQEIAIAVIAAAPEAAVQRLF
jgi:hypothetical protein